ncbi:DUF6199 domain-containing protein [Paenibacillus sediminis]|uniref:DUF6199 domain-containing protein n=1 Tax=Paenibacillus sediminis TaxID=664909 RepID=A0ABS4H6F5_9BACL|nr:DUF6199 family natural product biosynthesis protein [Paenibacillus sediminis]MBP1938061.1 hypothetical protein [Paenibacillus sediminis]
MARLMLIFIGIIFVAVGLLSRLKPTFGWNMNEGWKVKGDSEPSYAYIEVRKFSGFICIVVGSFFLVFGILTLFL